MSIWQRNTAAALRDLLGALGDRTPDNRDGFDDEFDALKSIDARVRENVDEFYTASLASNMSKNRYRDVLPNEGTRVVLDPLTARGDGDYINANYVDGRRLFGTPFVYIATQAPLESTVGDFWRMAWENNTAYIVMLCAEIEGGKSKSCRYFPISEGGVIYSGTLTIALMKEDRREDTVFRNISIRNEEGQERNILHMQHIRWPDQGVPHSSQGLMEMVYALGKSKRAIKTPIIVHCSGGVGRTGVFIAFHVVLALFQLERPISVPRIVQYLKYCRTGTVQRKDQYLFLYYAILREMEKMMWAYEHRPSSHIAGHSLQAIQNSSAVAKRGSEYYPLHMLPEYPLTDKSRVFAGDQSVNELDEDCFIDSYEAQEYSHQRNRTPQRNGINTGSFEMYAGEQERDLQQQRELHQLVKGRSQPRPIRHSDNGVNNSRRNTPHRSISQTAGVHTPGSKLSHSQRNVPQSESSLALNQQLSAPRAHREPDYGPMTPVEEQLSQLKAQNRRMRSNVGASSAAVRGTDDIYNSRAVSPLGLGIHPSAAPVKLHNILPRSTGVDKSISEPSQHSYNQEYLEQQKQRDLNNKRISVESNRNSSQRASGYPTGRQLEQLRDMRSEGNPVPSPVHTDLSSNMMSRSKEGTSPELSMKEPMRQQSAYLISAGNSVSLRTTLLQNKNNQQQAKNAQSSLAAVRAAANTTPRRNNDNENAASTVSPNNRHQYVLGESAAMSWHSHQSQNEQQLFFGQNPTPVVPVSLAPADAPLSVDRQLSNKQSYFFDGDEENKTSLDSVDGPGIANDESPKVKNQDYSLL